MVIQKLTKASLQEAEIPVPSIEEQQHIVSTKNQLVGLQHKIKTFQNELSLNPKSAIEVQHQIDDMMTHLNMLSDADRVRALIRKGETKTCEFKETLTLDVRKQTREKYIALEALKTVAGFLNSEGGTLLIGVADNGEVLGVTAEMSKLFKESKDKYLLHFKDILKSRIGESLYLLVDYFWVSVDEKTVLVVQCKRADSPCYLDGKEFYVRTNPSTEKLDVPQVVEYIKKHFG